MQLWLFFSVLHLPETDILENHRVSGRFLLRLPLPRRRELKRRRGWLLKEALKLPIEHCKYRKKQGKHMFPLCEETYDSGLRIIRIKC